ncbi:phage tail protein [Bacillus anthracis]|nr:phage tail protein [Bacillus anthracis]
MIVLDGIPAEQLGMYVLKDYVDPSIPATRDSSVVIPGRHGEIDFGAYLGKREFNFPIVLIPQGSYYEALNKTDELKKILIDPYGRPRTFKLIVSDKPDRYYNARYSGTLPINDLIKNRFFTLPLTAFDPHAYSIVDSTQSIYWGDDIPFMSDIPFLLEDSKTLVTSPTSIEITNPGSLVVRPKMVIFGNAENFALTINGERFFVGNFTQSTITIDAEYYTAIRVRGASQSNILFNLQGDLEKLQLFPGLNTIQVAGDNMNVTVDLQLRAKYI